MPCARARASWTDAAAMGGKGKGGARAAFMPPARPRAPPPGEDGGKTITEKIKERKAGGAEEWDEFKARVAKQRVEQHAVENHEVMMSAAHRELLDKEREARLRREPPPAVEKKKRRERDESSSSSDDSDSDSSGENRKRRRREEREHKKSSKKKHKHKHEHRSKDHRHKHKKKHKHRSKDHSDAADSGAKSKASEPVALSAFLAAQSDSD